MSVLVQGFFVAVGVAIFYIGFFWHFLGWFKDLQGGSRRLM